MAILTRGLTTFRNEVNSIAPNRDKSSDGWIGDQRHSAGRSGHNPDRSGNAEYKDGDSKDEVRAIDLDADLRVSGLSMLEIIQHIITKARAGGYVPFRYIIFCPPGGRPTIWARSTGWTSRAYSGSNRHDKHAHFSGDYSQKADEWTGSLGLSSLIGKKPVSTPVKVKMIKFDGELPELTEGMKDPVVNAHHVKRAQVMLNLLTPGETIEADGDYGSQTAQAVSRLMANAQAKSSTNGSKIGLFEWQKLYAF